MTMPLSLVPWARRLLLGGAQDTYIDPNLMDEWDNNRDYLCRNYDLFMRVTTLPATAGKAVYTVPTGTVSIISVIFNGKVLGYTDRINLDLNDNEWENRDAQVPKYWAYNAVPGDANTPAITITPREFVLSPAPDGGTANATSILLITEYQQELVPKWVEPILLYRSVANIARDNPNLTQPEKGEFFFDLADFWLETIRKLAQV